MLKIEKKHKYIGIIGAVLIVFASLAMPVNNSFADPDPNAAAAKDENKCANESGSMSWILCPMIQGIGDAISGLYENMVEPLLVVSSRLLVSDGTQAAWSVFRDVGNVLLVILFIVVIFSQLTGVGIDNYGIKKILPRLVVGIILVNVSYLVCQLAVDLSNILGSSLNNLLTGIAQSAFNDSEITAVTTFTNTVNNTLSYVGLGAAAGAAGFAAVKVVGWGLIMPIVSALIIALLAVLFFFLLLGLRKVLIVLLVIISPVALACYMLPNTQPLFKKWLKAFEGLLLVYPICGILIGGGTLASTIIVKNSQADLWTHLTGLLASVAPFFLVPSMLKSSFAAIGNIGEKLSNRVSHGSRALGGKVSRGIGNSRRMVEAQGRFKRNRDIKRSNKIVDKLTGKATKDGEFDLNNLSKTQQEKFIANQGVVSSAQSERSKGLQQIYKTRLATAKSAEERGQIFREMRQDVKNSSGPQDGVMQAAIDTMMSSGKEGMAAFTDMAREEDIGLPATSYALDNYRDQIMASAPDLSVELQNKLKPIDKQDDVTTEVINKLTSKSFSTSTKTGLDAIVKQAKAAIEREKGKEKTELTDHLKSVIAGIDEQTRSQMNAEAMKAVGEINEMLNPSGGSNGSVFTINHGQHGSGTSSSSSGSMGGYIL